MTDEQKLLVDVNKDNLARAIGFGPIYDGKAKFVLSLVLALTASPSSEVRGCWSKTCLFAWKTGGSSNKPLRSKALKWFSPRR